MVYYLKYRPKILAELDNKRVYETISKYLQKKEIPHAFLLTGTKGSGKTSTARIIAKSVNCKNAENGQACGVCDICLSIATGTQMDILEIDAASNRGIDEIRDLREKIKLSPLTLTYKVYIIDEVHMLTTEAFNALLKTLEEPPAHAIFILATTETHKVPDTIKSRCIRIDFHRATDAEISNSLRRIVKGEGLEIEDEALLTIAQMADGSFRDGAKLLEEAAASNSKITTAQVFELLGGTDYATQTHFIELLRLKKAKELLELLEKMTQDGKNIQQFFLQILIKLEHLLVTSFSEKELAWKREELISAIRFLQHAFVEAKTSVIPTLPFELVIVEYCDELVSKARQTVVSQRAVAKSEVADPEVDESVSAIVARWGDILEAIKQENHSIVGVLRSCRPLSLLDSVFTIEASYKFHAERLGDPKVRDLIARVLENMLGIQVKINTVLKKRV